MLKLDIPLHNRDIEEQNDQENPEPLQNNLTISVNARLFNVKYFLKIEVWHKGYEGSGELFPIEILHNPNKIYSERIKVQAEWKPIVANSIDFRSNQTEFPYKE